MKEKFIKELRATLLKNVDLKTRKTSSRFFKKEEEALVYGVKMREVTIIAKEFVEQIKSFSKKEVFDVCEELWKSKYLEEAVIACKFAESLEKQYKPADFKVFEHWVNHYVTNWADCDTLCNYTIGTFIMMYPEYINKLKKWAMSANRWTRRASAVTLIFPARKGLFLKEIFEIADLLLLDEDDLVQKGYGWMLKAASETNQEKVFDYIISRRETMPRTAFRYAIEKMPKELKIEAMKK